MRRGLLLPLLGLLCAATLPGQAEKKLTADELKALTTKSKRVVLLDVREPKELEQYGALRGSVNIPIGQLGARLAEVPKNRPVIPMCSRGVRATRAAELLRKNGYQVLGVAALKDWKEKNYPLIYPNGAAMPLARSGQE